MADRPITFSPAMVRALLAGTKMQTRRLIMSREDIDRGPWVRVRAPYGEHGWQVGLERFNSWKAIPVRHAVGDRLYVREHWRTSALYDETAPRDLKQGVFLHFIADGEEDKRTGVGRNSGHTFGKFRQAMHMPKWASRLTLPVTEVRVQRLMDISDADCLAEGVQPYAGGGFTVPGICVADSPRSAYFTLLDHLHGQGFSVKNPWLTATSFSVEKMNIDQARAA